MLTDVRNDYLRPFAFELQQESADTAIVALRSAITALQSTRYGLFASAGRAYCVMVMITVLVRMAMRVP
jgi:hypothetical protein